MTLPKLLLVDDEANILSSLSRLLMDEDFDVTLVESPFEALHLASKTEYAIIMSDHRMPHMEGTILLHKIKEISPASVRILLTGYADMVAAMSAINEGEVYRFLSKPWNDEELIKTLREAVLHFEATHDQKTVYKQNSELKEKNQVLMEKSLEQLFHNRQLCEELDRSYTVSVRALGNSIKLYDPCLWRRALSVKLICQKVAKILGLSSKQSLQLEAASLLHDIGKVGIPHALLRKPLHSLNPEELEIYQEHPFNGYSIVNLIPYFQEAALLIKHQNERFNGTGYPEGLQGEQIPAGSRLIAVADAYSKLKKGHPLIMDESGQQALTFLEKQSGTQFDPDAIALLRHCISNESAIKTPPNPQQEIMHTHWQEALKSHASRIPILNATESAPSLITPAENVSKSLDQGMQKPEEHEANLKNVSAPPQKSATASLQIEAGTLESQIRNKSPLAHQTLALEQEEEWEFTEALPVWQQEQVLEKTAGAFPSLPTPAEKTEGSSLASTETPKSNLPSTFSLDSARLGSSQIQYLSQSKQSLKNISQQAYGKTQPKYREVVISPKFLAAGMVLSRDLVTSQGVKLLQKGNILHPEQLPALKNYISRNGLDDLEIYVLKPLSAH